MVREECILTASAKGLSACIVVLSLSLTTALIPVVTVIGLNVPVVVGG